MAIITRIDYSKLRERMRECEMTGKDLARLLGRSDTAINKWLREGLAMPGDCIRIIAKSFHMLPDEISDELLGIRPRPYEPTADEVIKAFAAKIRESEDQS